MRKPLASRIAALTVLYCVVFFLIALAQFSNKGSFSLNSGAMTIRGHYSQNNELDAEETYPAAAFSESPDAPNVKKITGGVKIYYGGLEFNLSAERGKGLTLEDADGVFPVDPEYLILNNSVARFVLPGGTILNFNPLNSPRGAELRINAEFAGNISEVTIPIIQRRSSTIRDNDQIGVTYGGARYFFSRPGELEKGSVTLNRENAIISYQSRKKQAAFNPADYIIGKAGNYETSLENFKRANFNDLSLYAASGRNEDVIIAYLAEAAARGGYPAALASVSNFANSPGQTYKSACFLGGIANAYQTFTSSEKEKLNLITRLIKERNLDILKVERALDYLFTRSNISLANELIDIVANAGDDSLIIDHCPGLLEIYSDIKQWRPSLENPVTRFNERIPALLRENLIHNTSENLTLAMDFEGVNPYFSVRLGKALIPWARETENQEWEAIGKSLVLSALESGGENAGKIYNILAAGDYYPKAAKLTDNSQWAWTVSPALKSSFIDGNINIAASFPSGLTHYVILSGVRPFIKLQLHGTDWRSEAQFERADASGWIYYPRDQLLIVKLRHRSTVENIRIVYREEAPPPVEEEPVYTNDPWNNSWNDSWSNTYQRR